MGDNVSTEQDLHEPPNYFSTPRHPTIEKSRATMKRRELHGGRRPSGTIEENSAILEKLEKIFRQLR